MVEVRFESLYKKLNKSFRFCHISCVKVTFLTNSSFHLIAAEN